MHSDPPGYVQNRSKACKPFAKSNTRVLVNWYPKSPYPNLLILRRAPAAKLLLAGGGGSSATKSSYVSMVLIILVLVGAFVYNRRAFADLSAKLDVYRESGNQTMMLPEQTYAAGSTGGEVEKPAGVDETEFPAAINARHATSLTAIASAGSVDVNRSIPNPIYNTVGSRKNTRLLSVDTGLFEANAESVDYLSVDGQPDGTNDHSDNELEI